MDMIEDQLLHGIENFYILDGPSMIGRITESMTYRS